MRIKRLEKSPKQLTLGDCKAGAIVEISSKEDDGPYLVGIFHSGRLCPVFRLIDGFFTEMFTTRHVIKLKGAFVEEP